MSEGGEKTEEPTSKKIRDARNKGQVAISKDTVSTALLIAVFSYVWMAWGMMLRDCKELLLIPTYYYGAPFLYALENVATAIFLKIFALLAPLLLYVFIVAIASNFLQIGPLLAFESLKPDLSKLNPVSGMKKIFALKNVVEFLKSTAKVLFLGFFVYKVTKWMIDPLFKIPPTKMQGLMDLIPLLMKRFASYVMLAYTIVAAMDFFFQRHNHHKSLMMTRDEVKREYKESEGDPHIKGKRKQIHQEMMQEDNVKNTRKSTVVVTNPTHIAVALLYDANKKSLPIVVAKGKGLLAQRMRKAAEEEQVPIMENKELARTMYDTVKIRHYIPAELIEPVAAVLKWVRDNSPTRV